MRYIDNHNQHKKLLWQKELGKVNKMRDRLGKGPDKSIQGTIAILNLLKFPTVASCMGHISHGEPAPWVDIAYQGEPKWHYRNQKAIFMRIAQKHDIQLKRLLRGHPFEVWQKAMNICIKNGYTREFQKYSVKNDNLAYKLQALVDEFYREIGKTTDGNTLIRVRLYGGGEAIRLYNGKKDKEIVAGGELNAFQKRQLRVHLIKNKKHMKEFTEFLKRKYFQKLKTIRGS